MLRSIAGPNGAQLILSGKYSMIMTHWYSLSTSRSVLSANGRMRSIHDASLVGINTVINDDPQLNSTDLPSRVYAIE